MRSAGRRLFERRLWRRRAKAADVEDCRPRSFRNPSRMLKSIPCSDKKAMMQYCLRKETYPLW